MDMEVVENKKYRMLTLLNEQIKECKECELYNGGRCSPSFTRSSKYVIIGEAPGRNEVENNRPFCGVAGKNLWNIMNEHGFHREQFLIINSVNCRPVNENKNGKPTYKEIEKCKKWIYKYMRVLLPPVVLILGNYAMHTMINESQGITKVNGDMVDLYQYHTRGILSVHPSMCVYYGENGKRMLNHSIKSFKEAVNCYG